MNQIPQTELEAVNLILATIGESPVSSLAPSGHVDAVMAHRTLGETSADVQSRGWHFNTDKDYPLKPDATEPYEIRLPQDVARVDPSDTSASEDLAVRAGKLWDRRRHSSSFSGVDSVKVDVVWILPFEDLPLAARRYVSVRAARVFQDRVVGDNALHGYSRRDEERALAGLRKYEAKAARRNILNSSWSVARILARGARA